MSREALLARGQAKAEAGMVDACTIRRPTGTGLDDFSGTTVTTYLSPDPYTGKCRVQQGIAQAAQDEVGEDALLELRLVLQFPVSVVGLQVGDEITITASRDADLVGRVFRIRDLMHKTDETARRVGVVERTGS